jgi:copper oxidase (laccase) domain-containing protein
VFVFTEDRPGVALAFTDRHGGVSSGPWESLNLGTSNGDDPDLVRSNHERVADAFEVEADAMARMSQVHGAAVHVSDGTSTRIPVADALVTTTPGLALLVPATVAAMRELGATAVTAWLGPRVCGRCYEVPAAMRAEVAAVAPRAWSETSWGTPALDVGAGVRAQLEALGVHVVDLADAMGRSAACTLENDDLYSYRRQGQRSGRLGGLVRLTGAA